MERQRKHYISIENACRRRQIDNPYGVWRKLGGSKATWYELWDGKPTMIKTQTLDRLYEGLGIHLNEVIFFE